jgi:hypothetical protein
LGGVIIANTGAITLDAAKVLNTGAPLRISDNSTLITNNFQLTLGGDFIRDLGTITAGSSPVVITGTAATQNISGFTTTGALSMTKTAGTATITGDISASSLTMNGAGGTLNLGVGEIITISGTWTRTAGTIDGNHSTIRFGAGFSGTGGTFIPASGTVEWYAAGAQTIANISYNNLIVSGSGIKTVVLSNPIANDFTIGGSASVTPTSTLTVNGITKTTTTGTLTLGAANILSNTGSISLDGGTFSTGSTTGNNETVGTLKLTNNATIALGTGVHSLNIAASQSIPWTAAKVLTITGWAGAYNGTSGTAGKIFFGSSASSLTVAQLSQIRFYNGTTYFAATILATGEVVPTSTINYYSKTTGNLDALTTWTSDITLVTTISPASFTAANQIFNIRNQAAPLINASWTVSGTNSKIIVGDGINACNFTVSGAQVLTAPTNVSNLGTLTLSTSGVLTGIVFGTLSIGSTVNYARNGAQTVNVASYHHLTLSGSGIKTITGLAIVNGNFTFAGSASATATTGMTIGGDVILGNGTTFAAGAFTHFVAGNWTNNGGAFTNTGSTIYFMNTLANQQINGSATTQVFNNLTIAKSNYKLIIGGSTATATVVGTLTMISGNIDCGINTLQLGTSTATVGTLSYTAGNIIGSLRDG